MLDLKPNEAIDNQPVIVRQLVKKNSQNNKEYYHLQLSFGIKNYDAKIWSNNDELVKDIIPGCIASIWGTAREFKGSIQIHINRIERMFDPSPEIIDLVTPSCEVDKNKLSTELQELVAEVADPFLNKLLESIFNSADIGPQFLEAAAGAEIHHAYVGGLAQHTIEVAHIVQSLCMLFKGINYNVALAGALLHDIGKVFELSGFPENKYTDVGRMVGHIALGAMIIEEHASHIEGFPAELKMSIEHCILSHHGTQEMGSPVVPMTLEAVILHNADQTSAEINGFTLAIERDTRQGAWTDYNNVYKRFIRKF